MKIFSLFGYFLLFFTPAFQQPIQRQWFENVGSGEPEMNKTGHVGSSVTLPCTLDYQLETAIVWMDQFDNVLFFNEELIIDESRFELVKEGNVWNLKINVLSRSDSGYYRCIINTEPVTIKYIELIVFEPAAIDRARSSQDIMATEGSNVYLACNTTGYPLPKVKWRYRKATDLPKKSKEVKGTDGVVQEGEVLVIYNVTKECDDIYECIADNSVGYPDRHEIRVKVRFKPHVKLSNQKIYQGLGKETILTCVISAYPLEKEYWAKDGVELKQDRTKKYLYEITKANDHSMILSITINDINRYDYGAYKCTAVNSMGTDSKYMELAPDNSRDTGVGPGGLPTTVAMTENPVVIYKPQTRQTNAPLTQRVTRGRGGTRSPPLTLQPVIVKKQPLFKVKTGGNNSSGYLHTRSIAMVIMAAFISTSCGI